MDGDFDEMSGMRLRTLEDEPVSPAVKGYVGRFIPSKEGNLKERGRKEKLLIDPPLLINISTIDLTC